METIKAMLPDSMGLFLFGLFCVVAYVLVIAQRANDPFDLRTAITDPATGGISVHRTGMITALIVSTWAFVYLVIHDRLTEFYFTVYMTVWAGAQLANKAINKVSGDTKVEDPNAPKT